MGTDLRSPEFNVDFHHTPFIVIWEVTRACALQCLHCRAEAQHRRDPRELSTAEGQDLLRQIRELGARMFVFTGGDPLMREDLFELAAYAKSIGLRVSVTPSATPRVTREAMERAQAIGLDRWAFSLDGSRAEIHDRFRGVSGSFERTMDAIAVLRELGMPLQINTTVSRYNVADLEAIARLVGTMGVRLWSVFFLVPTGRGKQADMLDAEAHERVLRWMAELQRNAGFDIKATEAPHYRRVLLQQTVDSSSSAAPAAGGKPAFGLRAPRAVNDGNGFVFVSHIGEVYPSGFLPIPCGSVRETPLADIYRSHPVFRSLRDPTKLKGKCGVCEYKHICGGSRSRAYALTGDMYASDPTCAYVPARLG